MTVGVPERPRVHRPHFDDVAPAPLPESEALTRDVLERCRVMGFAGVGIAPVQGTKWSKEVLAWLGKEQAKWLAAS